MNIDQLLAWAQQHNYPQFVVAENDVVRPGYLEWEKLRYDRTNRASRVIARLEAFLQRTNSEGRSLRIVKGVK